MRIRTPAEIGIAIAELRERMRLSQRILAQNAALDQSAISRIEAGTRDLGASELYRIADCLGVTPDDILMAPEPSTAGMRLRTGDADDVGIAQGCQAFEDAVADYFAAMAFADLP